MKPLQEQYDEMVDHLSQMSKPCKDKGTCAYKNDSGNQCVVGIFIPEGHPGQRYLAGIMDPDLGRIMQKIHDRGENWRSGGIRRSTVNPLLADTAEHFGLIPRKLTPKRKGKS